MRSTARRGLVLLSLALLGVVVTGLAETEPPPQLYRIEVEIVGEHGQVELDPEGTPGAPGVFWYWGQPLDVQLTATSDDPERPFEKWLVGLTGEEPEERIENPTDVSFSPEEDDWTVVAIFANDVVADTQTISATADEGGTIVPSGDVEVPHGEDQPFTITPDPGHVIEDVEVDGQSVYDELVFDNEEATYTFENVTENHTIHASFLNLGKGPTLESGLHLVSVPLVPVDDTPESVFESVLDTGQELSVYEWAPGSSYREPTTIDAGHGYWLYLWTDVTLEVTGPVPAGEYEVALEHAGWHLVSTPRWPVSWQSAEFTDGVQTKSLAEAVTAEWIEPYAFSYSSVEEDYVAIELPNAAGAIDPWTGYWLKTREPSLTMILPLDQPHTEAQGAQAVYLSRDAVPARLRPPTPPNLGDLSRDVLTAVSYPSPVTGEQATFRVSGLPVDEVRVTVLDLGGRQVWQAESIGNQLSWNLTDSVGRTVANGVYLYQAEAKVGDRWVTAHVDRLLIVR